MKKFISLAVVALLSVSLVGCGTTASAPANSGSSQSKENLRIGIVASLTGGGALSGEEAVNAAKIAVEEVNSNGGINGQKLELVSEDDQTTNPGMVAAYQKVASNNVVAVIGEVRSTMVKAIMPYTEKYKVPVAVGGTDASITEAKNPWIFRFRPSDKISAQVMAKYIAEDLHGKKVAILHDTDAFGTGGKNGLVDSFKTLGIDSQAFGLTSHSTDYTAQLVNIKQYNPDVIATYATYAEDAAIFLRQAKEMGLNKPFIGSPSLTSATAIQLAKDNVNGAYGVADYISDQNPVAKSFFDKYKAKYNSEPDFFASWTYDAVQVLAKVMAKNGTKPEQIQQGLKTFSGWTGNEGDYAFDANGDGLHAYTVVQVKDGKQTMIKVVKAQ